MNDYQSEEHMPWLDDPLVAQALKYYEQSLVDGSLQRLESFIEQQVAQTPPRFQFLYNLNNDLNQRLITLKGHHFEVRERVISIILNIYHTDVTGLTPPDELERYHLLDVELVVQQIEQVALEIPPDEKKMLYQMITSSIQITSQLHHNIQMTQQICSMIDDWLQAYHIAYVRESQNFLAINYKDSVWAIHQ